VAIKNVLPNELSANIKGASIYSISWIREKYAPIITVISSLFLDLDKFPSINEWWDHVTLTPEDSRIIVFRRGTLKGSKAWIPIGGHCLPSSTLGDSLLWKNAQKKDIKNITSDVMNKIIPHRRPDSTIYVWSPCSEASREISRHHWYIIMPMRIIDKDISK